MVTRLSGTPSFAKSRLKKLIKAASGGLFYARQRVTTEGKGMSDKQVQLSGKCVLKIDTIKGSSTIEIPKVNLSGKNNADALLNEVFHFGVMRHGKNKLREMLEEKLDGYGEEYENHGLTYD